MLDFLKRKKKTKTETKEVSVEVKEESQNLNDYLFEETQFHFMEAVKESSLNTLTKSEASQKLMDIQHRVNFRQLPAINIDASSINLQNIDTTVDHAVEPTEPETTTLPAVISREIMASGIMDVKWTLLHDLPSMQEDIIRALASSIFGAYGGTIQRNIHVISSFSNASMLNEVFEVNRILGCLEKYADKPFGEELGNCTIEGIDDYRPLIKIYHYRGTYYMAVNEPRGQGIEGSYIYKFDVEYDKKKLSRK